MTVDVYYCNKCNLELKQEQCIIKHYDHGLGLTSDTILCPQCNGHLDHMKYKCDSCGELLREPAGTYNEDVLCEHCVDWILDDNPHLRFCKQCHRIADKILIFHECILCKFDQIDEDIHEINKTLRKMYKEEQKKAMSAGCMALAKLE